jgi:glucoamylase
VKKYLYDSKWPNTNSLIKRDLEYISQCWDDKCFDLWEEIYGHHFYTLTVQAKALEMGAEFAYEMDDEKAGDHYKDVAKKINTFIKNNFYVNNTIISSINIGHSNEKRDIDSSILLAYLHSNKPYDAELANTMANMVTGFREEYPVNKTYKIDLIGRYKNDHYYGGNPWVLSTSALSTFLLTVDITKLDKTKLNKEFFNVFGRSIKEIKHQGKELLMVLMKIEKLNRDTDLSFAEQIDKNNLKYVSADRLTWNYVELVRSLTYLI